MAKLISELPVASALEDANTIVVDQNGAAVKAVLSQLSAYAIDGFGSSFSDIAFRVFDNGDPTKKLAFEVGTNVPTGTTRTLSLPPSNGQIKTVPGRTELTDTTGSVEVDATDLDVELVEITQDLTGDLTVTLATASQTARRVAVYMSGIRGANTLKVGSLVQPSAGEIEFDTGETVFLEVAPGLGIYGLGKIGPTGVGGGSDATVSWNEVVVTGSESLTVAAHASLSASSGVIIPRVVKLRRASGAVASFTVPDAPGAFAHWRLQIDDAETEAVTIDRDSSGLINGGTSVSFAVFQGAAIDVWVLSGEGGPARYTARGDISGPKTVYGSTDFDGNPVTGGAFSILTPTGAYSAAKGDSQARIVSDGNVTIPTTPTGVWYEVKLGAATHDLVFNSTTLDVSAKGWGTGDLLLVQVTSATTVEVTRTAAADITTEADFA